jgi:hypothetical protein
MNLKNRLAKLETLNTKADYSGFTMDERLERIKFLMAERRESGCPNCDPCPKPKECAKVEELTKELGLMDEEST